MSEPAAALQRLIDRAIADRVFPAAVAEVGCAAAPLWSTARGHLTFDPDAPAADERTIFDLASLTKTIATTSVVLQLVARGAVRLDEQVRDCFAEWTQRDRETVTIADLLEHASGLPARLIDRAPAGRREIEHEICCTPLEYAPRSRALYSDLDFILLGFLAADRGRAPLRELWRALVEQIWKLDGGDGTAANGVGLTFGPVRSSIHACAPTLPLDDDPRRGMVLAGSVHDSYAYLLNGEAGHAGLFGTAPAVGRFARAMLRLSHGDHALDAAIPSELVVRAVRRSSVPGSSRALGWDTMLPTSSCGTRMTSTAFGQVGFTGTSLWIDPARDRYFVLLSNRACGGGTLGAMRDVRRAFHDTAASL